MRTLVLATGGALLLIGGIWTAAFTTIGSSGQPAQLGPAVVVGFTSTGPASTGPATTGTGPAPTTTPGTEPADDHGVHSVAPSPAVQVTDDHGGHRTGDG